MSAVGAAAVLYSFISTCQRHDLDPFVYLQDVFPRLPTQAPEQLAELLPIAGTRYRSPCHRPLQVRRRRMPCLQVCQLSDPSRRRAEITARAITGQGRAETAAGLHRRRDTDNPHRSREVAWWK
jgi:hypothetical protein